MSLSVVTHVRLLFVSCLLLSERKLVFHNTAFGRAVKLRRLKKSFWEECGKYPILLFNFCLRRFTPSPNMI